MVSQPNPELRVAPGPARSVSALLAAACGLAGMALAWHHPLGPALAVALFVAVAGLGFVRPAAWLVVVPALLPVIGLAPWSGWFTVEELDLLVLAFAAAGQARAAGGSDPPAPLAARPSLLTTFMIGCFTVATVVAIWRGVLDAGGPAFGWFQGYNEALNSVRTGKAWFLALLLLPLWRAAERRDAQRAAQRLTLGMALGLAGVVLAVAWERIAFTGLLNFSADYRATALFWEMHVGGAALDAYLALALPFALHGYAHARTPLRTLAQGALLVAACYACLTTFSRGVYLMLPVGVATVLWLLWRQRECQRERQHERPRENQYRAGSVGPVAGGGWAAVVVSATFAAAAFTVFPGSGYRGLLAVLGAVVLLLPMGQHLARFTRADAGWSLATGAACSAAVVLAAGWLPKGAYVLYAAAWVFTASMLILARRAGASIGPFSRMAAAGLLVVFTGIGLVAEHWGGRAALVDAAPALLALLSAVVVPVLWRRPMWPSAVRWQFSVVGTMAALAGLVGVLGGGAFMGERFSTAGHDLAGRAAHWRHGLALLDAQEWVIGKGMGRFPGTNLLRSDGAESAGDYRLVGDAGARHLVMVAGKYSNGWGEVLRVSQRIAPPVASVASITSGTSTASIASGTSAVPAVPTVPVMLSLDVRVARPTRLHVEVCEKHLIYSGACLMHQFAVEPAGGQWQLLRVALNGPVLSRGDWYAPKLVSFSMAVETREGRVDIRKVSLTASGAAGAGAVELLQNGDFSQQLAHWFFTSDSHHLPWHLESMVLGVLFDQGAVGLALWAALYAGAFWRVSVGSARAHTLAPPIAGALAGVFVVGLFSSVLDVSRVAFLIDLLVLLGLTVRVRSSPARHGGAEFPNDFTVARSALGAAGSAGEFRSMPASPMPASRPRASAMTPASPAWHPAPRTLC